MNAAIDMAVETATTKGLGEEIVEQLEVEAEVPAEKPEAAAETPPAAAPEAEDEHSDLADKLASLTHTEVVQTKAGKGLVAELQRERQKRQSAETELEALKAGNPKAEVEHEPELPVEEDEIDDEADVYTASDVKKIVAREIARAVKPLADRVGQSAKAERSQIMATGLAALKADQKAGNIPAGVNTASIVNQAVAELSKSRPAILEELLSEPDPVRAIYEYASIRLPEVRKVVTAAANTQQGVKNERLARGRAAETGDEPTTIENILADLNAP